MTYEKLVAKSLVDEASILLIENLMQVKDALCKGYLSSRLHRV